MKSIQLKAYCKLPNNAILVKKIQGLYETLKLFLYKIVGSDICWDDVVKTGNFMLDMKPNSQVQQNGNNFWTNDDILMHLKNFNLQIMWKTINFMFCSSISIRYQLSVEQ